MHENCLNAGKDDVVIINNGKIIVNGKPVLAQKGCGRWVIEAGGVVFQQTGENNMFVGNVGTLIINND